LAKTTAPKTLPRQTPIPRRSRPRRFKVLPYLI